MARAYTADGEPLMTSREWLEEFTITGRLFGLTMREIYQMREFAHANGWKPDRENGIPKDA